MELRRNIKAPKRYDDLEFQNEQNESQPDFSRPPAKATLVRPAFQAKIIEFNPDLPPAAFPTRDSWLPSKLHDESLRKSICQNQSESRSQNENENENENDNQTQTQTQSLKPHQITCHPHFKNPQQVKKERVVPQQPCNLFNYPEKETASIMALHSIARHHTLTLIRSTFSGEPEELGEGKWSNGPENPVYENNMKTLENLCAKTDEYWMTAEMETSDEEEPSEGLVHQLQGLTKRTDVPRWEYLSVAHQVDLVNIMMEICQNTKDAVQRLQLNPIQVQIVMDLIRQRGELEAKENDNLTNLQGRINQILMVGDADGARHMSQGRYREILEDHLYGSPQGELFYFSTKKDLAKARLYLRACGQDPKLLNHWRNSLDGGQLRAGIRLEQCKRGLFQKSSTQSDVPDIQVSKPSESVRLQKDQPSVKLAPILQSHLARSRSSRPSTASLLNARSTPSREHPITQDSNSNKEANKEVTIVGTLNLLRGISEAANTHSYQLPASLPTPPLTANPVTLGGSGFRAATAPMTLPTPPTPQTPNFKASLNECSLVQATLDKPVSTQAPLNKPVSTQAPLNKPASTQAPLDKRVSTQAALNKSVSTQGPPDKPSLVRAPLDKPVSTQASLNKPASIQAPLEKLVSAQTPLDKPVSTQAPLNQPASVEAPLDERPLVKAPLDKPVSTHALLNKPTSNQAPLDKPPLVQAPVNNPPLAVKSNRSAIPSTKTPPKPRNKRKTAATGVAGNTVMIPQNPPAPMIVKYKRKSRAKRAVSGAAATLGSADKKTE